MVHHTETDKGFLRRDERRYLHAARASTNFNDPGTKPAVG
jgi:hypothetical protein